MKPNHINKLLVHKPLVTIHDPAIFAIGDCAECTQPDGSRVPPRAQSAHQMATCCYKNILALLNNKPMRSYRYRDHGSLVSLAKYSTVGSLMGNLNRGSFFVEGHLARLVYISLYRLHQIAIQGVIKTELIM